MPTHLTDQMVGNKLVGSGVVVWAGLTAAPRCPGDRTVAGASLCGNRVALAPVGSGPPWARGWPPDLRAGREGDGVGRGLESFKSDARPGGHFPVSSKAGARCPIVYPREVDGSFRPPLEVKKVIRGRSD